MKAIRKRSEFRGRGRAEGGAGVGGQGGIQPARGGRQARLGQGQDLLVRPGSCCIIRLDSDRVNSSLDLLEQMYYNHRSGSDPVTTAARFCGPAGSDLA